MMADSVDDEWKGVSNVYTPGGTQSMTVIWEPGVYQILAKSRKPLAKPFQKWIFEEVLPSIRKTGSYTMNQQPVAPQPQLQPRSVIEYVKAAETIESLSDSLIKSKLKDLIVDEIDLQRNVSQMSLPATNKRYTIAKVRATELGYTPKQIGNGSALGKYVAKHINPEFKDSIGRFGSVNHYEVTPELDEVIHS